MTVRPVKGKMKSVNATVKLPVLGKMKRARAVLHEREARED
jgi:hypothetical protein